jgi:signal transduction histidine kinase/Tfp pilus assembly protein PilF
MKRIQLMLVACFVLLKANPQSSSPVIDSLKKSIVSESGSVQQFELLLKICEEYKFLNPDSCFHYSKKALELAPRLNDSSGFAKAEIYTAYYYYTTGKSDQALPIADKNIQWLKGKENLPSLLAQYYSFSGLCLMKMDRKKDALERFYEALKIAEQSKDYATQVRAQSNIGWVSMELNQYEKAIESFRKALDLFETKNAPVRNIGIIYNNLASCYGAVNRLDSAKKYSQLGISIAEKNNDLTSLANGHFILGTTFEKMGQLENALASFQKAVPIREKAGDPFFIVSDLAEIANLYAKMGRAEEGIASSLKALDIASKNNLTAKLPMIYTALAGSYEAKGDYKNANIAYKKLSDLKDSLYSDANPKALAEMAAKYETEKKEQQILLQRSELKRKNFVMAAIIVLVALAALLSYSLYRRYRLKQKAKMQAEIMRQQELATRAVLEAEERERQRIAKDLHDGVGQIMSAAKMNLSAFENELQFNSNEQKQKFERIITLVDESCKEVRAVSHNMMPNALLKSGLASAIREFTDKIDDRLIKIDLYSEGLNERMDSNMETVLYRVIQECVNNVIKHAKANHLDISLIKDKDGISATVEDNGRGFDTNSKSFSEGLGLKNIRTRVEFLKGTVEYNSKPGKGTLVAIHVPCQ